MLTRTMGRKFSHALQNGTGAVLSKLAVISIPFLLSAIGFLLNTTLDARDRATQQEIQSLSSKIDTLSTRFDGLATTVRVSSDHVITIHGDVRELQARQLAVERRLDERTRR